MAYHSLTLHMLISAPGDIPPEDMATVHRAINRWNFRNGPSVVPTPVTVIPILWSDHAYSEFGVRAQESLNTQLVAEADLAFAMFANRLGTPTGEADSGTVEEMNKMFDAGKHVSIVRSITVVPERGADAAEQNLRLEKYLTEVMNGKGLVMQYDSGESLAEQVHHVLTAQASIFSRDASAPTQPSVSPDHQPSKVEAGAPDSSWGVWPRVDVTERVETDARGRAKTRRNRYLVLRNRTGGVAKNVEFRYEDGEGNPEEMFDLRSGDHEAVAAMAPDAEHRFPIIAAMGTAEQAMCVVTWEDDAGEHETRTSLSLM